MKNWGLVLLTLALLAAGCAAPVDVEAERVALQETDTAWANSAPDVDLFVSFYAENGSLHPPDAPVATGHEAIRGYLAGLFGAPDFALTWTSDKTVVSRGGDLAHTTGSYDLSFTDADGNTVNSRGKSLVVWQKQSDGQWKVLEDIFSPEPPPSRENQ